MNKKTAKEILTQAGIQRLWWPKQIIKAEREGYMYVDVEAKAGNWTTCACGREDKSLKVGWDSASGEYNHEPKDYWLRQWGETFPYVLAGNNWPEAARLVVKIHNRAIKLLEKMK